MCGCVSAQSTHQSNSPPQQQSKEGQGRTHPNNVGYNDQAPSTTSAPSTKLSISDHPQVARKEDQPKTETKGNNGNGHVNSGMSLTDVLNLFFAGIVAVFTVLLVYVSWRQTKLMENQTVALENQTKLMASQDRLIKNSERAFVFVDFTTCNAVIDQNGRVQIWEIPIRIENFGNTPAKNLRVFAKAETRIDPLPDDFSFDEPENFYERTLGPRASTETRIKVSGTDIYEAKIDRKYVYVWGSARYRDILDDTVPHVTTFCSKVIVNGDPRMIPAPGDHRERPSLTFENHRSHNDAN
jgi:hypothetical protein